MLNGQYIIQVFAKAPIEGYCKTRLAKEIGHKQATAYHARMVDDTLYRLARYQNVQFWCKPGADCPFFQDMVAKYHVSTYDQQGKSLGDIMDQAARVGFNSYATAIVQVGTDCPQLDQTYIEHSLAALVYLDIVIGPADDGGYVLLAQKQYHNGLYDDIEWGTSLVLQQLSANIKKLGLSFTLLDTLTDIDTAEDLKRVKFQ